MVREYFLAPNFTTGPPSEGPIKLGTVLGSLDDFYPLNQGKVQPIPASRLHPVETQDSVYIDIYDLHTDHHPLTERVLGLIGRGPHAPDRRPEGDHMVVSCKHLDTLGFTPTKSYVKDTIESLGESHKPSSRFKRPVYMVTGLKIARDASYSSRVSTREVVGRDFVRPRNPFTSLAVRLAYRIETVVSSSWRVPDGFIVAFKVVQVWINHKGEVKFKEYNKKAVMEFEAAFEDENAPIFPNDGKPIAI
ncbi:major facilitator superfamily MFS-1 [Fusarium sp. NRRL 52700]|nr:major facilitator superfamily MFS-1 [Fusarium sp. NRRL 52700]